MRHLFQRQQEWVVLYFPHWDTLNLHSYRCHYSRPSHCTPPPPPPIHQTSAKGCAFWRLYEAKHHCSQDQSPLGLTTSGQASETRGGVLHPKSTPQASSFSLSLSLWADPRRGPISSRERTVVKMSHTTTTNIWKLNFIDFYRVNKKAMWRLGGFSSRSVSEQHHRRLTDDFLGQSEGKKRGGGDAAVSRLPPASTMTAFTDEGIDSQ